MKIVLENMLRRSRNSGIVSMDGIFVSVGNKYWEVNQENRNPRNELEKFLLKILGQNNFNNQKNDGALHTKVCGLLQRLFFRIRKIDIALSDVLCLKAEI